MPYAFGEPKVVVIYIAVFLFILQKQIITELFAGITFLQTHM